jgi:hypothetical protein
MSVPHLILTNVDSEAGELRQEAAEARALAARLQNTAAMKDLLAYAEALDHGEPEAEAGIVDNKDRSNWLSPILQRICSVFGSDPRG